MYKTAFNTTGRPVAIDADGRRIGGGDWGPVKPSDDVAKRALDSGRLVLVDKPDSGEVDPRAAEAFDATDRLNELAELPAAEVKEIAADAGVEAKTKAEAVDKVGREKGAR